ncbi:putative acyl-CoA synthase [Nocardia brasiliensis NBRC 14402]|uniref:AMP-binding protein n=1 Tax=Nocardia brasiliensis TaxID=37326 RepID=UPI00045CC568|nr:AMP-binding protein [Nocardia brasiliensis]GAJ84919.1 putative acyl-CoA synthase [Nocardia brasiliensis NBRC 14402]SUB47559.1 Long-chain-fatty-acid--AMP ligase FadD29 [Nocardia brasiliensis]
MRESWVTDVVAGYENDHAPAHEYLGENGEWTVVSRHDLLREVRSAATGWRAAGVRPGDRVAMEATDPRLFVPAFLGALWAGVMPVPVPPPPPQGRRAAWHDHVAAMAAAAQARAIALRAGNAAPAGNERTIVLDTVVAAPPDASDPCHPEPDATAYVQFSSGSTGTPRAIPARVAAVRANGMAIMRHGLRGDPSVDRGLSWLPLHHDMGLVGFVLAPLLIGVPVSFVPTRAFVRRPGLWLRAMSERRATISFAPNFAYALSARRTSPEEIAALRLDHVRVLGCGAEPINHAVLQHFLSTFAPAGLQPEALTPCYGLAEATLAVALAPPDHPYRVDRIRAGELSGGRAVPFDPEIAAPVSAEPENCPTPVISEESATIVSCGPPLAGHQIVVRDDVGEAVAERSIGEIWVRGPSIAYAYLGAVSATHHTFRSDGWLRTGDLGYLADGELFVTGRVKDLLILNGRNIDPQRVEWVAETVAGVRAGGVVACTRPGSGSEELVVVAECRTAETTEIPAALREAVAAALGIPVHDVVTVAPGTVPRTTSGKPRRQETRRRYLEGALHVQQS